MMTEVRISVVSDSQHASEGKFEDRSFLASVLKKLVCCIPRRERSNTYLFEDEELELVTMEEDQDVPKEKPMVKKKDHFMNESEIKKLAERAYNEKRFKSNVQIYNKQVELEDRVERVELQLQQISSSLHDITMLLKMMDAKWSE